MRASFWNSTPTPDGKVRTATPMFKWLAKKVSKLVSRPGSKKNNLKSKPSVSSSSAPCGVKMSGCFSWRSRRRQSSASLFEDDEEVAILSVEEKNIAAGVVTKEALAPNTTTTTAVTVMPTSEWVQFDCPLFAVETPATPVLFNAEDKIKAFVPTAEIIASPPTSPPTSPKAPTAEEILKMAVTTPIHDDEAIIEEDLSTLLSPLASTTPLASPPVSVAVDEIITVEEKEDLATTPLVLAPVSVTDEDKIIIVEEEKEDVAIAPADNKPVEFATNLVPCPLACPWVNATYAFHRSIDFIVNTANEYYPFNETTRVDLLESCRTILLFLTFFKMQIDDDNLLCWSEQSKYDFEFVRTCVYNSMSDIEDNYSNWFYQGEDLGDAGAEMGKLWFEILAKLKAKRQMMQERYPNLPLATFDDIKCVYVAPAPAVEEDKTVVIVDDINCVEVAAAPAVEEDAPAVVVSEENETVVVTASLAENKDKKKKKNTKKNNKNKKKHNKNFRTY